ncbi:hypothetical protein IJ732_00680, partial [bacterium]|nr:hypothetical protein [bacterium]
TEATEQTKFYKLSETDFKTKFESHLKTTRCDANAGDSNFTPNVCLADGSQFKYGTFDESCTDNICDTLTIDTNGKKGPNTAGKDRFTMNLTPNGVKALGESNSCETGLDCGAYILAHHKLFEGETTPATPVYANYSACKTAGAESCVNDKNVTLTKISTSAGDYYVAPVTEFEMLSDDAYEPYGTYTFNNNTYDDYWSGAKQVCIDKGMHLPSREEFSRLYESNSDILPSSGYFWTSDDYEGDNFTAYHFSFGGYNDDAGTANRDHKNGGSHKAGYGVFCVDN